MNKDYTEYRLLTTMLADKFNKEFKHLTFKPVKGTITEEYKINGESYVLSSSVDALEITNKDGGRYTLYIEGNHCHKIPKIFILEDFITIYETIVRITGRTIAVYQDSIDNAIIIEPLINL